jgi:transposase
LISDDVAPCIQEWVKQGPAGCGLNRANWTYAELADYLYKKTGIVVAETPMRDFCHRHAIHPYRPTYQYLRADPEKKAQAKEDLATLKKSPEVGNRVVKPG